MYVHNDEPMNPVPGTGPWPRTLASQPGAGSISSFGQSWSAVVLNDDQFSEILEPANR